MTYDLFYFYKELDLLEIRLNILDDYVDYFILVEGKETFMGDEKDSVYLENNERFAKWNHKIIHYIVDKYPTDENIFEMALASPNTGMKEDFWMREFYYKESARKVLENLKDDDIVFVSDCDEIWNPNLKYEPKGNEVLKPRQLPYLYYLNQRTSENWLGWTGTTCCRYETIKNGIINHIRTDDLQEYIVLENGGWHFCTLGGVKFDKHPVYESDKQRREKDMRIDEIDLPKFLIDNKEKYVAYFK